MRHWTQQYLVTKQAGNNCLQKIISQYQTDSQTVFKSPILGRYLHQSHLFPSLYASSVSGLYGPSIQVG